MHHEAQDASGGTGRPQETPRGPRRHEEAPKKHQVCRTDSGCICLSLSHTQTQTHTHTYRHTRVAAIRHAASSRTYRHTDTHRHTDAHTLLSQYDTPNQISVPSGGYMATSGSAKGPPAKSKIQVGPAAPQLIHLTLNRPRPVIAHTSTPYKPHLEALLNTDPRAHWECKMAATHYSDPAGPPVTSRV